MPYLDFACPACGNTFGELVRKADEEVACPVCGGKAERVWSGTVYSATGKPSKKCSGNCKTCGGCH